MKPTKRNSKRRQFSVSFESDSRINKENFLWWCCKVQVSSASQIRLNFHFYILFSFVQILKGELLVETDN